MYKFERFDITDYGEKVYRDNGSYVDADEALDYIAQLEAQLAEAPSVPVDDIRTVLEEYVEIYNPNIPVARRLRAWLSTLEEAQATEWTPVEYTTYIDGVDDTLTINEKDGYVYLHMEWEGRTFFCRLLPGWHICRRVPRKPVPVVPVEDIAALIGHACNPAHIDDEILSIAYKVAKWLDAQGVKDGRNT